MKRFLDNNKIKSAVQQRFTAKIYNPEKQIKDEDLKTIKEIFQYAPSSTNSQPWKMLVVKNQELKKQLADSSWDLNKQKILDCPVLLIFLVKKVDEKHVKDYVALGKQRGMDDEQLENITKFINGFVMSKENVDEWATHQVYINLGFIMSKLSLMGIDSTAIEGLTTSKYDEILNLNTNEFNTVFALAIGYASESELNTPEKSPKIRFEQSKIIDEFN